MLATMTLVIILLMVNKSEANVKATMMEERNELLINVRKWFLDKQPFNKGVLHLS